jgi:8-oxo-dGTP diphosphatase
MQAATLVYIQKDNKTLMLHRVKKVQDFHEWKWNGLGWKFEQWESPEECVIREIQEEVGLNVLKMQFKGLLTAPLFDGKQDWIIYIYLVTEFSGAVQECKEWVTEWIDNDKILDLNLRAWDRKFIPLLFEPWRFSCKATYIEKELNNIHIDRYL